MAKAQILVVEDDSIVVMELRDRLQSLGYAVATVASSGEEAIAKAAEMRPDLVLMDIRLKGAMDGIKAAEEIRARCDIPVVYLTAYADENTLQRAKVTEPYGYILKPFEERELHSTIKMALYKHKMERKLKESAQWLATTLRSIGDAVIATDAKGCVIFMNPVAEALTGWKQEDALDKDLTEVFHIVSEEGRKVAENLVAKVIQEGIVVGLANNTILIAKEGREIPIDDSAAPIRDDKGNIAGVVLVFRDITERKRAEEQLQRYAAELEQANEEIKQFAYIVSHDLRAPLTNLKGFSEELYYALEVIGSAMNMALPHLDEKQRLDVTTALQEDVPQALGFIESSVDRMDHLINAVLELARLGRRKLKLEPIDMDALVQATLQTLGHQIEECQVKVTVGALPEVVADRTSMGQVIGNLLNNAVLYLDPGRPGEIEVTAERGRDETTFRVWDNGRGIAVKDIDKVFAPFRRVGKQDVPGEGMGLAYVQTLVRRHGGRIWVESEQGKGSTFYFTIPTIGDTQQ